MHQAILTYAALKAFLEALLADAKWVRPQYDNNKTIDEDLFWFCSIERAREIDEGMNRRELAEMMLSGVPAMSEKIIEEWLDGFYTDLTTLASEPDKQQVYIEVTNTLLAAKLKKEFGIIDDDELEEAFDTWREKTDELFGM